MNKTLYFALFLSATAMIVTAIAYAGYTWAEPIIAQNRIDTKSVIFSPKHSGSLLPILINLSAVTVIVLGIFVASFFFNKKIVHFKSAFAFQLYSIPSLNHYITK